jgi:hypothetical protein
VNDELSVEGEVVAYFKLILEYYSSARTEENHETLQSGILAFVPKIRKGMLSTRLQCLD